MANGFGLEFDNLAGARTWNPRLDEVPAHGGRSVIGFALPSSTAVDQLYAELTGAGYGSRSRRTRHSGAGATRLIAPDLNQVGLMGPIDPQGGFTPAV